jgi:N utilization substance protein B
MSRTQDRKNAFVLLFSNTFGIDNSEDFKSQFTKELFDGVNKNIEIIDDIIGKNLKNWKIERISRVSKCAMRIGVYEILREEIPIAVAVNESVEIAKIFGSESDANYVQAVLSSVSSFYKKYMQDNNLTLE